jgi:hypothetical protein
MSRLRATAVAAALLCSAATLHANAAENTACVRDMARAENDLVKTLVRVRGAANTKSGERCTVYQHHIAIVTKAREVFSRCKTGSERDAEVSQLDGALSDANAFVAKSCTSP